MAPGYDLRVVHLAPDGQRGMIDELLVLLEESLTRLGVRWQIKQNDLAANLPNLILGHTVFAAPTVAALLARHTLPYAVVQLEAIDRALGFVAGNQVYLGLLTRAAAVLEAALPGLQELERLGIRSPLHLPIGASPSLERFPRPKAQDLDAVLAGTPTPRRMAVVEALRHRGLRVEHLHGVFGAERDRVLARAKVHLNVHQLELPCLERLRIAFLLNNRAFVLSENSEEDPYRGGVRFVPYDLLVEECVRWARPEAAPERARIAETGYRILSTFSMDRALAAAMARLGVATPGARG